MPCLYKYQMIRWKKRKIQAIEYLGGRCAHCGLKDDPVVYDFHHKDPSTKDVEWHKLRLRKWESVLKELDKCVLLCSNCHRKEHFGNGAPGETRTPVERFRKPHAVHRRQALEVWAR